MTRNLLYESGVPVDRKSGTALARIRSARPRSWRDFLTRPFLTFVILCVLSFPGAAQQDVLESIEQNLKAGRNRQALTDFYRFQRELTPQSQTPKWLFLEVKVLAANGLVDMAQQRLETLKMEPGWESEVDQNELLALEMKVLKSSGRAAEALSLVESRLPYLDEIDPPYSPEVTELYHAYAELLFACSQYEKGTKTLFDLLSHGDPKAGWEMAETLLRFTEQGTLSGPQLSELAGILGKVEGPPLWHRFALATFEAGAVEVAEDLLSKGFEKGGIYLRALWPGFLEGIDNPEFLSLAANLLSERVKEEGVSGSTDLVAMLALTLEKLDRGEEALGLVEGHLGEDPDLQSFAARVYAARGDVESASRVYAELEQRKPGAFLDAWGSLLAANGETEKAFEIWSRTADIGGKTINGYRRWGRLLKEKGFLKESKNAYMEGIQQTQRPELFASDLLEVSLALGDVQGALLSYQALRDNTQRSQFIWTTSRLVQQLRNTQQVESFADSLDELLDSPESAHAKWRDFAVELQTELALHLNRRETIERWISDPPPAVAAYWEAQPNGKADHLATIGFDFSTIGEDRLACAVFSDVDSGFLETRNEVLEAAARASTRIGQTTAALEYWNLLWTSNRSTLDQKLLAAIQTAQLHLQEHEPGKALEWLGKLPSGIRAPTLAADTAFLKGLAYTQLHEKRRAIPLLQETVNLGRKYSAEALYWLAEWELWQRNTEPALELYREVLVHDPAQELANESLWRIRHLGELEKDQAPLYGMAAFFEASGDFEDAEENYRRLAAQLGPSDLTDWVYYRIGKNLLRSGRREEAISQWELVVEKATNPTLLRCVRLELAGLVGNGSPDEFQKIVLDSPNTLLGDLALERMRNLKPEPTPQPDRPRDLVP